MKDLFLKISAQEAINTFNFVNNGGEGILEQSIVEDLMEQGYIENNALKDILMLKYIYVKVCSSKFENESDDCRFLVDCHETFSSTSTVNINHALRERRSYRNPSKIKVVINKTFYI